jgi:hypothetical protein
VVLPHRPRQARDPVNGEITAQMAAAMEGGAVVTQEITLTSGEEGDAFEMEGRARQGHTQPSGALRPATVHGSVDARLTVLLCAIPQVCMMRALH